jgi:uncharacterized membrane protein YhaH (DUF805 family)
MWDLCNQFVVNALTGGLVTLVLYLMIFKRRFRAIGISRKLVEGDRGQEWLFWCLGSALFANVVAHFGINYMVHLTIYLFLLLVCISVATSEAKQEAREAKARLEEAPAKVEFPLAIAGDAASLSLNRTTRHSLFEV